MTIIDNYLNKYLDGTISEPELQEFRALLENEPQLQTELRQVLDLRSLIHDDLLELTPPDSLSQSVRDNVGAQFAALAFQTEDIDDEEEEKRRPIIFNRRFAGSLATAMLALVLVALAPTLIDNPNGVRLGDPIAATVESDGDTAPALADATVSAESSASSHRTQRSIRSQATERPRQPQENINAFAENASATDSRRNSVGEGPVEKNDTFERPNGDLNDEVGSLALENSTTAENNGPTGFARENPFLIPNLEQDLGKLDLRVALADRDEMFGRIRGSNSTFTTAAENSSGNDEATESRSSLTQAMLANSSVAQNRDNESSIRRLSFGFTVGAGGLTGSSSAVSVTQKAGYATYSLNDNHRIGIEAGGSTFRYTHTTVSQSLEPITAKTNTISDGPLLDGAYIGNNNFGIVGRATGFGSSDGNLTDAPGAHNQPGSGGEPAQADKGKLNAPALYGENGPSVVRAPGGVRTSIHTHSYESDSAVGYGMVFYDRRVLSVSDAINIHGRLGLGGTDGGMIFDLRAYAAFATNRNVAITVGVGGSALRDFAGESDLNANYGLQVGAELGF